jgi:hypothetical protein
MASGFPGYDRREEEPSVIPPKIRQLFQPGVDIVKVFDWMEKRYHLHPDWRRQFKEDLKKMPKELPEQEFFFRWATQHLNHSLQTILRRRANIIEDIAFYILKDRIAEKERENNEKKNFYKNGSWKQEPNKM